MRKAIGLCGWCRETLFYDTEAGEPVPHNCPMEDDYVDDAQKTISPEARDMQRGRLDRMSPGDVLRVPVPGEIKSGRG